MNRKQRYGNRDKTVVLGLLVLSVLIISLMGIIYLRIKQSQSLVKPAQDEILSSYDAEYLQDDELPGPEENTALSDSAEPLPGTDAKPSDVAALTPQAGSSSDPESMPSSGQTEMVSPAAVPEEVHGTPKRYTEETYQLVTDMVYAYRHLGAAGNQQVETALDKLKGIDPQLGTLWEGIMREWARVSEELTVTPGILPENLPNDSSLCIAVMGYHLNANGDMLPEMEGRCETALRLLDKYPNAILALTGGGTAPANSEATEAETMARWFLDRGVSPANMIVENLSLTTGQNAKNTCAILTSQYAQVKTIIVVSSDYHIAQCELLFTEAALLHAYINDCDIPYRVAGYAALQTEGTPEDYSDPGNLWLDIWVMADPHY